MGRQRRRVDEGPAEGQHAARRRHHGEEERHGVQGVRDVRRPGYVLDHPGQLRVGYTPTCYVRTSHVACRLMEIRFKAGKKGTGGQKVESPEFIEKGDMCELVWKPTKPFVVDDFKSCEGLSRVAMLEGSVVCMIGKVTKVNFVDDSKKAATGKK